MNPLVLALAYLRFHWGRSLVLVLAAALVLFVPVATRALLDAAERELTARAEATPLLLGRRGSALDLAMAALHFAEPQPGALPMDAVEAIRESGLATPIPLHTGFETGGRRIVGTTLDYFDFRGLEVAEGRGLALLGEAVLGAGAARALGLGPGDALVSAPATLFDLGGAYPLEMPVVGVLAPTGTPDDAAVFVDLKTAWIIAGIGHGHDDTATDGGPAIETARRITPETLDSFHFHGDPGTFPVTAAIVVPRDARAATILQGRYLDPGTPAQLVRPAEVMQALVDRLFRIRALRDAVAALGALAALAALGLALFLSYRLRAGEVTTAVRLGAGRGAVARLVATEAALIVAAASALAGLAAATLLRRAEPLAGWLLTLGT